MVDRVGKIIGLAEAKRRHRDQPYKHRGEDGIRMEQMAAHWVRAEKQEDLD